MAQDVVHRPVLREIDLITSDTAFIDDTWLDVGDKFGIGNATEVMLFLKCTDTDLTLCKFRIELSNDEGAWDAAPDGDIYFEEMYASTLNAVNLREHHVLKASTPVANVLGVTGGTCTCIFNTTGFLFGRVQLYFDSTAGGDLTVNSAKVKVLQ